MPHDARRVVSRQTEGDLALFLGHELPLRAGLHVPVARRYPPPVFLRVPPHGPVPELAEKPTVTGVEHFFSDHRPVVVRPAPDEWVELLDERRLRHRAHLLDYRV